MPSYTHAQLLRTLTDEVVVGVSGGKDSVAALDLCTSVGIQCRAFFMYEVPGLAYQQDYLAMLAARYHLGEILQLPHPDRIRRFTEGRYCLPQPQLPVLTHRDAWEMARRHFGVQWFVTGEKRNDSLERRAQLSSWGVIQPARHKAHPLADWSDKDVFAYLARRGVPLHPEYAVNDGHAFNGLIEGRSLYIIAREWPEDYRRILKDYPFAEAARLRYDMQQEHEASHGTSRKAGPDRADRSKQARPV